MLLFILYQGPKNTGLWQYLIGSLSGRTGLDAPLVAVISLFDTDMAPYSD